MHNPDEQYIIKPTAQRATERTEQDEAGGLDEYDQHDAPESQPEVGGIYDNEAGYYEDGGLADDDDEAGGFEDDEEGGIDDDEDEAGGWTGEEDVDEFIERGGRKKRKKKKRGFLGLFRGRGKKKKKRRAPGAPAPAGATAEECQRLGYGSLELASQQTGIRAGMPYVSVSSGLRVIESPIPMGSRIPAPFLKQGLLNTALRTAHTPVNTTLAPGAGAFTLNLNGANTQYNEAIGLILDVGPQPLNTQAGAVMSVGISGRYVDGDVANLGTFRFSLPSVQEMMRIVFFFYNVLNGAPRPKMMYCANNYDFPLKAAVDPVTQPIVLAGNVPAGLFLSATLLGPGQPTYENLLSGLIAGGCC
jgi:hypothetical protein